MLNGTAEKLHSVERSRTTDSNTKPLNTGLCWSGQSWLRHQVSLEDLARNIFSVSKFPRPSSIRRTIMISLCSFCNDRLFFPVASLGPFLQNTTTYSLSRPTKQLTTLKYPLRRLCREPCLFSIFCIGIIHLSSMPTKCVPFDSSISSTYLGDVSPWLNGLLVFNLGCQKPLLDYGLSWLIYSMHLILVWFFECSLLSLS